MGTCSESTQAPRPLQCAAVSSWALVTPLKEEVPGPVGAQYAPGDQWRNNSRKSEVMEPKQKQHPAVDVTGDGSKVQCCKEQYC